MRYFNLIILIYTILPTVQMNAQEIKKIDELAIYYLPQFSMYLVNVDCNSVKKMDGVKKLIIKNNKSCQIVTNIFNERNKYQKDTSVKMEDFRVVIELINKGKIMNRICCAYSNLFEIDGQTYMNDKIENFLAENKLMLKFF